MILAVVGFFVLWVCMALPRGRESSRLVGCEKNLSQIGVALQLYHQAYRGWMVVPPLDGPPGEAPIAALLDGLKLPHLVGLNDPGQSPKPGQPPGRGAAVPGLICPSDPNASAGIFAAPISYRATAGDSADGRHGPFEPGRGSRIAEVEDGDGLAYTAAFAERLVGDGREGSSGPINYAVARGEVGDDGCPANLPGIWKGDAGSSWAEAGWRSTLYNHVLAPNGGPTCLADDGKTAAMGASSGHPNRVNVLYLDGSVRGTTPGVDLRVWRASATIRTPTAP